MKKKLTLIVLICLFFIMSIFTYVNTSFQDKKTSQFLSNMTEAAKKQIKINDIKSHYNKYVKTINTAKLYDENYKEIGEVAIGYELTLSDIVIDEKTKYFFIEDLKYFIKYSDVSPINELSENDSRYKKYIVFNENIVTNSITNFYNSDELVLTINKSFNLPIVIKEDDSYYVDFNNELYHINKTDVEKTVITNNTTDTYRTTLAVLAYHFIYDPTTEKCVNEVCLTESKFDSQIKYLADNNYLTLTMKETEYFLDGKIRIPKNSVTLTIDDGWLANRAVPILEKYKINATLFLITSVYSKDAFQSKYLELQSHGDNIHNTGVCPGGQGGGLKCLPKTVLLADLAKSRAALNGATAFCYPFYEYNDYAVGIVKEAGFTLGFIGGYRKATTSSNKLLIPRLTVMYDDTLEDVIELIQ